MKLPYFPSFEQHFTEDITCKALRHLQSPFEKRRLLQQHNVIAPGYKEANIF